MKTICHMDDTPKQIYSNLTIVPPISSKTAFVRPMKLQSNQEKKLIELKNRLVQRNNQTRVFSANRFRDSREVNAASPETNQTQIQTMNISEYQMKDMMDSKKESFIQSEIMNYPFTNISTVGRDENKPIIT